MHQSVLINDMAQMAELCVKNLIAMAEHLHRNRADSRGLRGAEFPLLRCLFISQPPLNVFV